MTNKVLYLPDVKTGEMVPLRLVDNGDGTYSLAVQVVEAAAAPKAAPKAASKK